MHKHSQLHAQTLHIHKFTHIRNDTYTNAHIHIAHSDTQMNTNIYSRTDTYRYTHVTTESNIDT